MIVGVRIEQGSITEEHVCVGCKELFLLRYKSGSDARVLWEDFRNDQEECALSLVDSSRVSPHAA